MGRLSPILDRTPHSYTKSKAPWLIGANREAKAENARGDKFGWRLFHYLSGGGMKAFGRTIQQEEADMRRTRFLVWMAAAAVVWFVFWI